MKYTKHLNTKQTPQTEKIPGSNQQQNNAGGYSFALDRWSRLESFLILGSEGGSYYAGERKLTRQNAKAALECIAESGKRAVDTVVNISDAGRAPKNDVALFVLALAASYGDEETQRYAFEQLPKVARFSTHLFNFISCLKDLRGFSKKVTRGLRNWYESKSPEQLAYQLTKYQQRDGWSHRDVFRLCHVKTTDAERNALYRWAVKGAEVDSPFLAQFEPELKSLKKVWAFERAKRAESEAEIVRLITDYNLPRECIPTNKQTRGVWEALLPGMGTTALLRNLGNLSKHGVLGEGRWDSNKLVIDRLTDRDQLKRARIHPLSVLVALNTYSLGRGVRGRGSWAVVPQIKDALNDAFYASFDYVEPANKRFLVGLDVSGSMSWGEIAGMPGITPAIGAAAMVMTHLRTEPKTLVKAFSNSFKTLDMSAKDSLEEIQRKTRRISMGGTDCSLPMVYARENRIKVDAFVVYTDSETWAGRVHPIQALDRYQQALGIPAKLIVVGMVSNGFSIADSSRRDNLDVVGFDTSAPKIITDFVRS